MIQLNLPVSGLRYYFTAESGFEGTLLPPERAASAHFGAKRRTDFATGRYCLRQCTALLGYEGAILIGDKGRPLLPEGMVGSISHSPLLCGAVAASTQHFRSVGIDIESAGRVFHSMWQMLFVESELRYLSLLPAMRQPEVATIIFSLKEAFYKLQFPLTGVFLDFKDVEVIVSDDSYFIGPRKPVSELFDAQYRIQGHVYRWEGETVSVVYLEA